ANQGFGIAISGSNDEKEQPAGIFISDVLNNGPASGLLQIGDRITSCNGYPLEHADYSSAIKVMKEAQQLNMIVKRRVPVPFVEFEQRTLKFTLSKSRKKDDFGIVLGCKFYIKEILNPKLAEKEPGLKEGDSILRINGQSLDGVSLDEATRLLQRSREKLSLVVQRDVRRGSNGGGGNASNRWPSQTTVYERLGSVHATPRQSPTPAHYGFAPPNVSEGQYMSQSGIGRKGSTTSSGADYSPASGYKRTVSFQKGPSGLGIRVIGGNQVGIFISAVQEQSPADLHGIRVGDRIHAVNSVSIAGLTREEAFDILLSLGEQSSLAVEHAPEEFAQVKAGKFGDSFYVRSHFTYNRSTSRGAASQQPGTQQPIELSIRAGDIFHVTDTLFGGSLGYWQATKLSFSSRKLFGGSSNNGGTPADNLDEVLSGAGSATNSFTETIPPAYERVALKRPAFHRPVVLYGPLADVARQLLLSQSSMRFGTENKNTKNFSFKGAPLPSTSSITSGTGGVADPLISSLSVSPTPERGSSNILGGIRLSAVDTVMASQKHCVLCVNPASVERLQLAQYAPIVVLIDVESRSRVRELRAKAGVTTQSARKLVEQAQKLKRQYSHLLTATLDATKEDQWFEALRALIFHLQERRVWMPEFQLDQPLDEMLLLPMQPPGDTPTSDGDKSDYGTYDPQQQPPPLNNGSLTISDSVVAPEGSGPDWYGFRGGLDDGAAGPDGGLCDATCPPGCCVEGSGPDWYGFRGGFVSGSVGYRFSGGLDDGAAGPDGGLCDATCLPGCCVEGSGPDWYGFRGGFVSGSVGYRFRGGLDDGAAGPDGGLCDATCPPGCCVEGSGPDWYGFRGGFVSGSVGYRFRGGFDDGASGADGGLCDATCPPGCCVEGSGPDWYWCRGGDVEGSFSDWHECFGFLVVCFFWHSHPGPSVVLDSGRLWPKYRLQTRPHFLKLHSSGTGPTVVL
uniref:PDZ domain-containing protein n=1 Tax=Meloidogyne javanica TaxID=6303 RepID=A0A915MIG8_MELJA